MKTNCPVCNQHLEYGDDFAGTTAPCPKCGAEVSFPNLRVCPDCGAEVSRRAGSCPNCGAPLTEAAPAAAPVSTAPGKVTEKIETITIAALIGIAPFFSLFFPVPGEWRWVLFLVGLVGASVVWGTKWEVKCPCGYEGKPKVIGDAGCIPALLLLCLGIIPGLIYLAVMSHPRFFCPKCGREGFR